MRYCALLTIVVAVFLTGCSDDDNPPFYPEVTVKDGSVDGVGPKLDQGHPWDGFDPKCPMPGPCVLEKKGEGKHAADFVVIGEILTLSGKELDKVTAVYIGAAKAPLVDVSATKVTCRVGPRTPPGQQTIELEAATLRRMAGIVDVRRFLAVVSTDGTKLQTFHVASHSAGPVIDMGEKVTAPAIGSTGRFLAATAGSKLVVVDLALEQAATVSPSEPAAWWAIDDAARTLVVATQSGKLESVELSGFPTLSAKAVSGAAATAAVFLAEPGLFAGLTASAGSGQGSLWYAKTDLKSFSFAQKAGNPFVVGAGQGLKAMSADTRDGRIALVVGEGATTHLVTAKAASGALSDPASLTVTDGVAAGVAAGGGFVALSADATTPRLSFLDASAPTALKNVALGSGSASRVLGGALPTLKDGAFALVGPKPTASFTASRVELVDLATSKRHTLTGDKPAVELSDIRAGVADPVSDRVHVITGTHFYTYNFTIDTKGLTVKEQDPHQQLLAGTTPAWVAVQP
jgi:hypothetical protein